MQLKITHDDVEKVLDLDLVDLFKLDDWDNQELALLESQIGSDEMERWFRREDVTMPTVEMLNTLIWCRLSTIIPGIAIGEFRFKLGALVEAIRDAYSSGDVESSLAALSDTPKPSSD